MKESTGTKKYMPLVGAAGIGSMLGSGIIIGLSATIAVWQSGLGLTDGQVGILSGALTFAIAAGSLLAGNITKAIGLIRAFNYMNLLYLIGAAICILSGNFPMLLAGLIIAGFASGADLPISLTVISHDAPDEKTSAELVASTQVFWQIGVLGSYAMAFIVSRVEGAAGARMVFALLAAFAAIAFLWRTFSGKFKEFHEAGDRYRAAEGMQEKTEVSFTTLFKGKESGKYTSFFLCILIFYVCWNLLANTFGQFQTFILVKANASQSLATGCGIVLNIVGLICGILFASLAGSGNRNKLFYLGIVIQAAAMIGNLHDRSHDRMLQHRQPVRRRVHLQSLDTGILPCQCKSFHAGLHQRFLQILLRSVCTDHTLPGRTRKDPDDHVRLRRNRSHQCSRRYCYDPSSEKTRRSPDVIQILNHHSIIRCNHSQSSLE